MDLETAIKNPRINAFDIIQLEKGYTVYTYFKPNETKEDFQIRHWRNEKFAERLKKTKPLF
jgi:hypothetical protein